MPSATHPFLVDQTPFLNRNLSYASSSSSSSSASSRSATPTPSIHSTTSTTSSSSSTWTSYSSPNPINTEIDNKCLRWMRETQDEEYVFGSCSRRGGLTSMEREVLRDVAAQKERQSLDEERSTKEAEKAEKKKRRFGKLFG